ncbi:hypothetical protein P691DRAFT_36474 [Macrolepiota fuliginosa MF-IS2]|uniref:Uncharacterized protein n=1 Tax=Macrolepiota fuliginosa MF-IS2 TaxID=1400762 RepID=A0A9P6BV05_9AGAR|nr:hypothetical protein P691DRAFT_36474 [Macrolepiota fuliginosa MF-IS2]
MCRGESIRSTRSNTRSSRIFPGRHTGGGGYEYPWRRQYVTGFPRPVHCGQLVWSTWQLAVLFNLIPCQQMHEFKQVTNVHDEIETRQPNWVLRDLVRLKFLKRRMNHNAVGTGFVCCGSWVRGQVPNVERREFLDYNWGYLRQTRCMRCPRFEARAVGPFSNHKKCPGHGLSGGFSELGGEGCIGAFEVVERDEC